MRQLAAYPWTLFVVLLAINAVGRPCSITAHDARLYSLQAINQAEEGAYAEDVFLSYGSQDQFSIFSRVAGPLVVIAGLRLSFFLLYVVFNTLFILACFRLVRTLIDDTLLSTLALIFLVSAPLPYGGFDIFMVHEQFFTPRVVGSTLTLFALEFLLRQRFVGAFCFLLAGSVVHPLMAFGGVMIWLAFVACTYLSPRVFASLVLAAVVGGVTLLSFPELAMPLFGPMDGEWHQTIHVAVGYNYPADWLVKDWVNLALSFALPLAGCIWFYRGDPIRQRFLLVATLAGLVGFVTTLAASMLPYALLFQAQPYRVLWILKVLQIPLGFLLIARWSQSPVLMARLAALALLTFFCVSNYNLQEFWIFAIAISLSVCFIWARADACEATPTPVFWLCHALGQGLVLGAIGWTAFRWWFFLTRHETIAQHFDLNEWVLTDLVSPMAWIAAVGLGCVWLWNASPRLGVLRCSALAIALLAPVAFFASEASPAYVRDHTRLGRDIAFLREFTEEHGTKDGRVPSLYCSLGRADLIWIDVKATNYFDILQTAGVMFNRRTAEEINRRICLVNKFEMARQRQEELFLDEARKTGFEDLLKVRFDCPEPTVADLGRLCREPGLDFVAVPHCFSGLYSASNGRLYVYECEKVRTALRLAEPEGSAIAARSRVNPPRLALQENP